MKDVLAKDKEIEMKMKEELKKHMSLFLRVSYDFLHKKSGKIFAVST